MCILLFLIDIFSISNVMMYYFQVIDRRWCCNLICIYKYLGLVYACKALSVLQIKLSAHVEVLSR